MNRTASLSILAFVLPISCAGTDGGSGGTIGPGGATGGAGAGGGGSSGGAAGGSASAGSGAGSPNCVEVRLEPFEPPGFQVSPFGWLAAPEGRLSAVGLFYGNGMEGIRGVRQADTTGKIVLSWDQVIAPPFDAWANTCAWKPGKVLCVGDKAANVQDVDLGITQAPPTPLDVIPTDGTAVTAHWDGEAFAVHFLSNTQAQGGLELIRVDETGKVIQPRKLVGTKHSVVFSIGGPRFASDPVSGRFYSVIGSGLGTTVVSAHERDGTPLWELGKVFTQPPLAYSEYPGVGAHPNGILFVAPGVSVGSDFFPKPNLFRLGSDAKLEVVGKVPIDDGWTTPSLSWIAVHAKDENNGWFVLTVEGSTGAARFLVVDYVDGVMQSPRVLMEAPKQSGGGHALRLDFPMVLEVGTQRWVGVQDLSATGKQVVRVFRVDDPACTYPAITP